MRCLCLFLLLAAACDRGRPPSSVEPPAQPGLPPGLLDVAPAGPDEAVLRARAERVVPAAFGTEESLRYRDLRAGADNAVCGEASADDIPAAAGAYRRFIVGADGIVWVAPAAQLAFDDPADAFAARWIDNCATTEELRRLRETLGEPPPAPPLPEVVAQEPLDLPAEPALEDLAVPPEPAPAPRKPPPPATIDSFVNSVSKDEG